MRGILLGGVAAMVVVGSACSSTGAHGAPDGGGSGDLDAGAGGGGDGGTSDAPSGPAKVAFAVAVSGNGTVTSNPDWIACSSTPSSACSANIPVGDTVVLTAATNDDLTNFAGWSGACGGAGSAATCTLTLAADTTVGATFVPASTSLVVIVGGTGSGTITSSAGSIDCTAGSGAACTAVIAQGAAVTLAASPAPSSVFAGWSGGGCSGASPTCTTTIAGLDTVTATFTIQQETLTVEPVTGGTLVSSPAGITCGQTGSACSATFSYGTPVTLAATALAGWQFDGWASCPGYDVSGATCTVTMTTATFVEAAYAGVNDSLAVAFAGSGSGTITAANPSNDVDIECPYWKCSADIAYGTTETLTATPAAGSRFLGWSGGPCSGSGSCEATIDAPTTITGTFGILPETLSAGIQGSGTGTITGAGLDCGAAGSACSTTVPYGEVTLTATPAAGSVFSGWWGACHGANAVTTVDVTAATTCVADFEIAQETLTITSPLIFNGISSGSTLGDGEVVVTTAGGTKLTGCTYNIDSLDFDGGCSVTVPYGTSLTLTPTALADPETFAASTFYGWWSGPCSGSGACTVAMTSDTMVSAEFGPSTGVVNFTLVVAEVTATGAPTTGTPNAEIDGDNIGCSGAASPCHFIAATGVSMTLGTYEESGAAFYSWTGPCPSFSDTCTFTPTANTTVTASFYSP